MTRQTISTAALGAVGTGITLAQVNTILGTIAGLFTCTILGVRLWNLLTKGREEKEIERKSRE